MMKMMMSTVWIMMIPSFSVFLRLNCANELSPAGRWDRAGEAGAPRGPAPFRVVLSAALLGALGPWPPPPCGPLPGGRLGWGVDGSMDTPWPHSLLLPSLAGGQAPNPPVT